MKILFKESNGQCLLKDSKNKYRFYNPFTNNTIYLSKNIKVAYKQYIALIGK